MGSFLGALSDCSAPHLGAHAIKAAIAGIPDLSIDEVYMGNVISAGVGQAPARQASLLADISISVPATTVSKVCGSGMKAIMLANNSIRAGESKCVVAGGMESMSRAPFIQSGARAGYRIGHQSVKDAMMVDGLEDVWTGKSMGLFGQMAADKYQISREEMDAFALESLNRAVSATAAGYFENEITPISYKVKADELELNSDELVAMAKPEKIPHLRPAFSKDGSITAANSSAISDGAAALLLADSADGFGSAKPLARIVAQSSHAREPAEFTTAPVGAIKSVLEKANWRVDEVDLFEINEAFAVVTMIAMRELGIEHDKVNIHGGACILGHPLGASGARIVVTLLHALRRTGKRKGIASLCIGGGEATAIAIEMV